MGHTADKSTCCIKGVKGFNWIYFIIIIYIFRTRSADVVSHLVSTWPYNVLNLSQLEVPIDALGTYFTKAWGKDTMSLAEMIIKGLLSVKPDSKLRRVVLPHSECEGTYVSEIAF